MHNKPNTTNERIGHTGFPCVLFLCVGWQFYFNPRNYAVIRENFYKDCEERT